MAKKIIEKVLEVNDEFDAKVDAEIDKAQTSRFSSISIAGMFIGLVILALVLAVL